jgi:hypothetical protein
MQHKRRSGRIAKQLAIVLLGTDTTGKMFSEETKTVVLSRHGAGVVSRYRFAPDEVLTLRMPASTKEAVVRLVGQIGGEPGRYVYGLAFVDPDPHFWPMEFPSPDLFEPAGYSIVLACSFCHARQNVEQHEIEEDVYSVNGNILRYCEPCGASTPWKKAQGDSVSALAAKPRKPSADLPAASSAVSAPSRKHSASHALTLPSQATSYSGASAVQEFAPLSDVQTPASPSSAVAVLLPPDIARVSPAAQLLTPAATPEGVPARLLDASGRPVNQRRNVRIRVSFSACVRHPAHADEIVECENISKGGVCFHSLQQYALDSLIDVAAPFSPGESALFVPAQIRRVEPLSGGKVFRYGVEYIKSTSAK